jgi:trigger factor
LLLFEAEKHTIFRSTEMAKEQEATTPKNTVKIKDSGPCRKKVCIEIPEQSVKAATDEQYGNLSKDTQVPGFRRGRGPRRLLEKRFGKEVVEQFTPRAGHRF